MTAAAHFNTAADWHAGYYQTSGEYTISYAYDAFGRMVTRTAATGYNPSEPVGTITDFEFLHVTTENFVYWGQNNVLVLDGNGQVIDRNLTGLAPDQVFATEEVLAVESGPQAVGTVNWLLTDNQGTVRDVVQFDSTTDTTAEVDHLVYGAFGALVSQAPASGATDPSPIFYYNGVWQDPQTGLYDMGARWYDAVDAVFASYDPLGFGGGQNNLSEYCANDPTNLADPSGMGPILPTWDEMQELQAAAQAQAAGAATSGEGYAGNLGYAACNAENAVDSTLQKANDSYFSGNYWLGKYEQAVQANMQVNAQIEQFRQFILNNPSAAPTLFMGMNTTSLQTFSNSLIQFAKVRCWYWWSEAGLQSTVSPLDFLAGFAAPSMMAVGLTAVEDGVAVPVAARVGSVNPVAEARPPLAAESAATVTTPRGLAVQSFTPEATALRNSVADGQQIFRAGNFPESAGAEGQYWSTQSPLTPGYANSVGAANLRANTPDFILGGNVNPGAGFITRYAPAYGSNAGGALEIVTQPGGVQTQFFHMP